MSSYPASPAERSAWVLAQRGSRVPVDEKEPYGYFTENERASNGEVLGVATILLTNRECPWKCVMCDLWKHTLTTSVTQGSIPAQIDFALARLPRARHIKLYNSGSFFDRGAVPIADYPAIAARLDKFDRVVVESHPALIGPPALGFRDMLRGRLEVAMGLETAHPEVLAKLNKGMDVAQFSEAAKFLLQQNIDLRTFILVQPPFLPVADALPWAKKSVDVAFESGASVVTLIPTRAGNGAMELLRRNGQYVRPAIQTLEAAVEYGIALKRGRVFADLWDLERSVMSCSACFAKRSERLRSLNLTQTNLPPVECSLCGSSV